MMKKRRYGVLLAGLLCICMVMPLSALAVDGEASSANGGEAVFELSYPPELPAVGETFEVTVSLKNNPGFGSVQFTITSDSSVVKCESVEAASLLQNILMASNPNASGGAKVSAANPVNITGDGDLVRLSYSVLAEGRPEFGITVVAFDDQTATPLSYVIGDDSIPESGDDDPGSTTPDKPVDQPGQKPSDTPSDHQGDPPSGQPGTIPADKPSDQPEDKPADTPGEEPSTVPDETISVKYTDISDSHWAYEYVYRATEAGLFNGFPDGSFHPDENVTRAQFITVLWRMSGSPETEAQSSFVDTPSGAYYIDAVRWGAEKGFINGAKNPDGTFSYLPDDTITREQVMTILFRFDGEKSGMESLFTTTYDNQFTDSGEISDYARKAMYWAYYKTYISGTSSKTLSPKGLATRAQISKILVEYQSGNNA